MTEQNEINCSQAAEWKRPAVLVKVVQNPTNGWVEVILQIPAEHPGEYMTEIGAITINEVTIGSIVEPHFSKGNALGEYVYAEEIPLRGGIPGAYGRAVVDLTHSTLGAGVREIALHRKGIGSSQLSPTRRLWVDVGQRLAEPTGWEEPVRRWTPVGR